METIDQEKEYIILLSIARYGYSAMPQNFKFLSRYSMQNLYFDLVNGVSKGINTKPWEDAVKEHASNLLPVESDVENLRKYKLSHGNKETKKLLDGNTLYWKVLLSELKKQRK